MEEAQSMMPADFMVLMEEETAAMHLEYYFCAIKKPGLCEFLDAKRVRYRILYEGETFSDGRPLPVYVKFRFRDDLKMAEHISQTYRCSPVISAVYSESERSAAPLLWMTPVKQSVDITNTDKAYAFGCEWTDAQGISRAYHKEQIDVFQIKKEPMLGGKTALWSESTGFSEVFADRRIMKLFEYEKLEGAQFKKVLLSNGMCSEQMFQMTTENRIDAGRVIPGKGEKEIVCPMCGMKQYGISDAYQLHLNLDQEEMTADFYMTQRVFGYGIAQPLYLVSQRFYRGLRHNRLDGNVRFDPVIVGTL